MPFFSFSLSSLTPHHRPLLFTIVFLFKFKNNRFPSLSPPVFISFALSWGVLFLSFSSFFFIFSLSFPSIRDCTFSARFNLDDPHSAILSTLPSSLLFTFTTLHESSTREEARNRALSHEHGSIEWPIVIGGHDPPFLTFLDRWWKYYVQSFRNTVEQ